MSECQRDKPGKNKNHGNTIMCLYIDIQVLVIWSQEMSYASYVKPLQTSSVYHRTVRGRLRDVVHSLIQFIVRRLEP